MLSHPSLLLFVIRKNSANHNGFTLDSALSLLEMHSSFTIRNTLIRTNLEVKDHPSTKVLRSSMMKTLSY